MLTFRLLIRTRFIIDTIGLTRYNAAQNIEMLKSCVNIIHAKASPTKLQYYALIKNIVLNKK